MSKSNSIFKRKQLFDYVLWVVPTKLKTFNPKHYNRAYNPRFEPPNLGKYHG
jgi:hypothetical protein